MPLSATKLISNLKKPFDKNYWAKRKADERGITKEEILKEWEYTARVSTEKGTAFHNYVENYLSNRIFPYPESKIKSIDIFDGKDPVKEKFDVLIKMFDSFYKKINGILIPIKSEFVIGDEELQIAGMVDQIFYNKNIRKNNETNICVVARKHPLKGFIDFIKPFNEGNIHGINNVFVISHDDLSDFDLSNIISSSILFSIAIAVQRSENSRLSFKIKS
jgi:hypothetical protein